MTLILLSACKDLSSSPENLGKLLILKTLDSIEVSFLLSTCTYNGFPGPPLPPRDAVISGKLRFQNVSHFSIADSIFLDHGKLFRKSTGQSLFDFTFSDIYWYGDTTSSASLKPGEIDSVWFAYRFDPKLAPCQDSVYFHIVVTNSYGDSLTLRSPTVLFTCSQ